jgi:hypothetical protein
MSQLNLLWGEGQKRLAREMRSRLTENYRATLDANLVVAQAQAGDRSAGREVPWYAKAEEQRSRGLTGEELDKALAIWKLDFPDRVS